MGSRSRIKVSFKGKEYAGEYEIAGRVVRVYFEGKSKTGMTAGSDPELSARIFLINLVSGAVSKTSTTKLLRNRDSE